MFETRVLVYRPIETGVVVRVGNVDRLKTSVNGQRMGFAGKFASSGRARALFVTRLCFCFFFYLAGSGHVTGYADVDGKSAFERARKRRHCVNSYLGRKTRKEAGGIMKSYYDPLTGGGR